MAKRKSRKQIDDASQHRNQTGFNLDARKIGVAIAGVLVTEIVNAAVQKLSHKFINDNDSDTDVESDTQRSNPLQEVAAKVGGKIGEFESSAGDVAQTVRSSANNLTVNLSDVVDLLRDVGQRLKDQSADVVNTSSEAVLSNISNRATAILDRTELPTQKKSVKVHKNKKNKKKRG